MSSYKALKNFAAQKAADASSKKPWWEKLLNLGVKTLAITLAIALAVATMVAWWVGDNITDASVAILERISISMPRDKIDKAAFFMVLGFTWPIVVFIFRFWKHRLVLATLALVFVGGMIGFYNLTEDEMFGEGREARFICDPILPTDTPLISRTKKNPRTKGECDEVTDPVQVAVAIAIMRAQKSGDPSKAEPRVLTLEEIADPRLELFKNKLPLVYMSKMEDKHGLRQMRAGPWFDGFSPGTMVPATWVAVEKVQQHLANKKAKEVELAAKKADDEAKARSDAVKAAADKVAEKDKLYWKNRYIDLVTGMNVEARKAAAGGLNEAEMDSVRMMYINLGGELDKTKLMLPKAEWPNMRLESLPNARRNEAHSVTTRTAKSTSVPTANNEVVMIVRLINREPPDGKKFFEYGKGMNGNRVRGEGIYVQSLLEQCGKVTLATNDEEPVDLCKIHNQWVNVPPGAVYKTNNLTEKTVLASIIKH